MLLKKNWSLGLHSGLGREKAGKREVGKPPFERMNQYLATVSDRNRKEKKLRGGRKGRVVRKEENRKHFPKNRGGAPEEKGIQKA